MIPAAHVSHRMPGRVRVRIPQRRGEHGYFEELHRRFEALDGVAAVTVNAATGSVLLVHAFAGLEPIRDFARAQGLFDMVELSERMAPLWQHAAAGLADLDGALARASRGGVDMRSVLLVLLLGFAGRQLKQGNVMAPAATLLWYALQLVTPALAPGNGRDGTHR